MLPIWQHFHAAVRSFEIQRFDQNPPPISSVYLAPRDGRRPIIFGSSFTIDKCANASRAPAMLTKAVLDAVRPVTAADALAKPADDTLALSDKAAITVGAAASR